MKQAIIRGIAASCLAVWLAGCVPASSTRPAPAMAPTVAAAAPVAAPPPSSAPAATLTPVKVTADAPPASGPDLWEELRGSFVMDDCGGSNPQAVAHWAQLFTESPGHFEQDLRRALPSLRYIQQIAKQRNVPGEFVLLPWIESHYLPVFGRRDRPVGMWQITPSTARSMGLQVSHRYDARLDTAATTEAIFDLINQYYEQYHDWRLADYAFNSGTGTVNRLLARYGTPSEQPSIPRLPVRRSTREHLIKLMAIACVIREPTTFGVQLPHLPPSDRLESVVIPKAMPVAEAAAKAGLPAETLTQLNSGFLDGTIDPQHSDTLLLPRANVQHWYDSHPQHLDSSTSPLTAPAPGATDANPDGVGHHSGHPSRRHYKVAHGDTLASIARRHHLTLQQLTRWNHLGRRPLRPGQILDLGPTDD
ncbi:transglycosylase SLT domain-containing protein [Frateuria aurantia]